MLLSTCSRAVLLAILIGNIAAAQQAEFQYRFKNESIVAATDDEPVAARFSATALKSHVDRAASLWAGQKKCVSCHTHGIYMFVRPALTDHWGKPDEETRTFIVAQAVRIADNELRTGSTPAQMAYIARGLAAWDKHLRDETSSETDAALRYLFQLQAGDGSIAVKDRWPPLNSDTYHATVAAALAVGDAPGWLANLKDDELLVKVTRLQDFLRDTSPRNDHQRLLLLWASTRLPKLLTDGQRQELVEAVFKQQQEDGGWSIRAFATPETLGGGPQAMKLKDDPHYQQPASDGYQTGLAVVVLRDAGAAADDPRIQNAVAWLLSNQRTSGRWWTRSLNTTSRFHYIAYSGTAYAALALAKCDALPKRSQ